MTWEDRLRRHYGRGFIFLISIALLSNITEAARYTALIWSLGNPNLPVLVLVVMQVAALIGGLLGAAFAPRLAASTSIRKILGIGFCLQAVYALAVSALAVQAEGVFSASQAYAVAILGLAFAVVGSCLGVCWIATISEWHGDTKEERPRLFLDSTQYQAGKLLGPLLGAVALSVTDYALAVLGVLDALTYLVLASVISRHAAQASIEPSPRSRRRTGRLTPRRIGPTAAPLVILLLLSIGVDGPRLYLARLMQESGTSATLFGTALTASAIAAITTGVWLSRSHMSNARSTAVGAALCTMGLVAWIFASQSGAIWVVGSALIGAGAAAAFTSCTSEVLAEGARADRRMEAASAISFVRQSGVASSGLLTAALLALIVPGYALATHALLIASVPLLVARQRQRRLKQAPQTAQPKTG